MMRKLLVSLFAIAVAMTSILTAQSVVSVSGTSGQGTSERSSNVKLINAEFREIQLIDALQAVARQANLKLLFAGDVLPARKQVSTIIKNASPSEAFGMLLRGTQVRAVISPAGEVVLVRGNAGLRQASGIITGKVTDAKSGKGIQGATVSLGNNSSVVTGDDGVYRLSGVVPGVYSVTVRLVGYSKQIKSITMGEGATVIADFKLDLSANVLDQVVVTGTIVQTELKAVPNAISVITAKQIEERGITSIDQLFRGDIPGLFALRTGAGAPFDQVSMYSRGATGLSSTSAGVEANLLSNPIKTYVDGVELADAQYLSQIDPKSIERIEILTGPQASTIYGSNALNGVMQIFTKRGSTVRPQVALSLQSGWVENNFSSARTPQHDYSGQLSGVEGRFSYNVGGSWNYIGPWTPSKQSARTGSFGGIRFDVPALAGRLTADVTARQSLTQANSRANATQPFTAYQETGWYSFNSLFSAGGDVASTSTLTGKTFGLLIDYAPFAWWSHELRAGSDVSDTESRRGTATYSSPTDTSLSFSQSHVDRKSFRYATTARIPLSALGQMTIIAGAENWQGLTSSLFASPQLLTGTLANVSSLTRRPGHNAGGFLQSQIGLNDRLFITYGIRLEKNPTIGEKARVVPGRYGVAYTHDLGAMTAKLRGSYGRSIRPPSPTTKDGVIASTTVVSLYGVHDRIVANQDLTPEHQQGGEGGVELYFGNRGSLVVTRYNQTVDQLIALTGPVDSVRSLAPCPTTCSASSLYRDEEGHAFRYQSQNINVGSIRNQGWELQGSANTGPITLRGTYSWTKSRTLGVTPTYRALFPANRFPQYQRGATFKYLPEHTWAFGVTYAHNQSSVALNVTGSGRAETDQDRLFFALLSSQIRLPQDRLTMTSDSYVNFNAPYTLADINASHRINSRIEMTFQVSNLMDRYVNDRYAGYASMGRQAKIGGRLRTL